MSDIEPSALCCHLPSCKSLSGFYHCGLFTGKGAEARVKDMSGKWGNDDVESGLSGTKGWTFFPLFILFFIEVQLIYNVVLVSGVQQSDSVIHIYTFFFIFFSIMVYRRMLNIVPCVMQ